MTSRPSACSAWSHGTVKKSLLAATALLLAGCAQIWNAGDLAAWVRDRAVKEDCVRDTIELQEWYTATPEGNVWRGACKDATGMGKTFGINVDRVWRPSE
jgi:hypothetical protein